MPPLRHRGGSGVLQKHRAPHARHAEGPGLCVSKPCDLPLWPGATPIFAGQPGAAEYRHRGACEAHRPGACAQIQRMRAHHSALYPGQRG